MIYELGCCYCTQKSFYGKAVVEEHTNGDVNIKQLYSYGTLVARITEVDGRTCYNYFGSFSRTTSRHQREFFMQEGLTYDEVTKLFRSRTGVMNK